MLDTNPFTSVTRAKAQEKRLFMTVREVETFLAALDKSIAGSRRLEDRKTCATFRLLVEFMLNTGLRRNEALNLRERHIDLERRVIYVERTKDKELRVVPLNTRAREILALTGDKLFSGFTSNQVTHIFSRIARQAGLKNFKLHSLRHTFASALIARGVDLYTVSKLLGHTDLKTTMVYAKMGIESMQGAVERLQIGTAVPDTGVGDGDPNEQNGDGNGEAGKG